MRKYRSALDAGADPVTVSAWIAEVNGERVAAERELGATMPREAMTVPEVRALIQGLRSTAQALANADPALKAELT